jgi:hypothetical protein
MSLVNFREFKIKKPQKKNGVKGIKMVTDEWSKKRRNRAFFTIKKAIRLLYD